MSSGPRLKACPTVLTVCPGYWRARESFEGLGFRVIDLHTEPFGFAIPEAMLVAKAEETKPDLLYLSLPNNPTGAIFDPEVVIAGVPEGTAVIIDLTLPCRAIDARALTHELYQKFRGRGTCFWSARPRSLMGLRSIESDGRCAPTPMTPPS